MGRYAVDWLPVSSIAEIVGCSRQRIHQLVRSRRLESRLLNRTTLISVKSLDDYLKEKGRKGRG